MKQKFLSMSCLQIACVMFVRPARGRRSVSEPYRLQCLETFMQEPRQLHALADHGNRSAESSRDGGEEGPILRATC